MKYLVLVYKWRTVLSRIKEGFNYGRDLLALAIAYRRAKHESSAGGDRLTLVEKTALANQLLLILGEEPIELIPEESKEFTGAIVSQLEEIRKHPLSSLLLDKLNASN